MYDYANHRGVSGTPSAFVNGVKLSNLPDKAEDWLQLITDVYNSRVQVKIDL